MFFGIPNESSLQEKYKFLIKNTFNIGTFDYIEKIKTTTRLEINFSF